MTTILVTAPYMIPVIDRFRPLFERFKLELIVAKVEERLEEPDILSFAGKYDGTICGDDRYTARALEAASPRLKVISKWGTGIDSIDREAAERLGIQVYRTPNAFTMAVADTTLGYLLAFARSLPWMDRRMKAGDWGKMPSRSLSETTLGVVGVGTIGKAVIRRARPFGMRILGTDIIEIAPDFIIENGVTVIGLEELLKRSDFVSLHCDLNPTSYHLLNQRTLAMMKPTAILVNTARGPVIDEPALIEALGTGRIAGAALDVFEQEPLPKDSRLLAMDNVMLAPHNANSSPFAWERVHRNTIRNLLIGLGLEPPEETSLREA
jgi:D-3-phosphoglycerate dehydrogenase